MALKAPWSQFVTESSKRATHSHLTYIYFNGLVILPSVPTFVHFWYEVKFSIIYLYFKMVDCLYIFIKLLSKDEASVNII